MKYFTDYEKIKQVLKAKRLSVSKAEGKAGLGATTISKLKQRKDGDGSLHEDNLQKFLRTFHVNPKWWETSEGEMFLPEPSSKETFDRDVGDEAIKREMLDQLYKDLANQARHLDKALDLVARLLPPGNGVESVAAKDR
jgi:transcriptional regulator with XRE-family HTH domain